MYQFYKHGPSVPVAFSRFLMAGRNHPFWGLIGSGPGPVYQRWHSKYLKTNVSVLVINTRLLTPLLATLPLKTNLLILTI